jgi:hypothetical protein
MFRGHLLSIAVLLAIAGVARIEPSAAQEQQQPAAAGLPSDEQLDALLAAKKWDELGAALSQAKGGEPFARKLDWLQAKIDAGGGFFVVFMYAKDLWLAGNSAKIKNPDQDTRVTAGLMTLYAYQLILVDGAKCEDVSALSHRTDQLLMFGKPMLSYLKAKPEKLKAKIIDLAIAYEKHTAPLRKNDDVLCRGGLKEILAGLEGGATREGPSPPGEPGKSFEVEPPASYAPQFLAPDVYLPLQEKARSAVKTNLAKLLH